MHYIWMAAGFMKVRRNKLNGIEAKSDSISKCCMISSLLILLLLTLYSGCLDQKNKVFAVNLPDKRDCVILLHGLARTSASMDDMEQALEEKGYKVVNVDYPSTEYPIEELASRALPAALDRCSSDIHPKINFVTHSMGGILLRYYLTQTGMEENIGRVVMLSPPNQGSEIIDTLRNNPFFKWLNGPAGQQLGTGPDSIPLSLGPVTYPVGIITGNKHSFFDGWFSEIIPGEDDGKVSVDRAKVGGMTDFIVLPYSHTFIMQEEAVIEQTLYFLKHGLFKR